MPGRGGRARRGAGRRRGGRLAPAASRSQPRRPGRLTVVRTTPHPGGVLSSSIETPYRLDRNGAERWFAEYSPGSRRTVRDRYSPPSSSIVCTHRSIGHHDARTSRDPGGTHPGRVPHPSSRVVRPLERASSSGDLAGGRPIRGRRRRPRQPGRPSDRINAAQRVLSVRRGPGAEVSGGYRALTHHTHAITPGLQSGGDGRQPIQSYLRCVTAPAPASRSLFSADDRVRRPASTSGGRQRGGWRARRHRARGHRRTTNCGAARTAGPTRTSPGVP